MSAVSSKTPLAAADPSAPSAPPSPPGAGRAGEPTEAGATPANADFGTNEWLVDELYQQYLADPASVDRAWWSFFADYQPVRASGNQNGTQNGAAASLTPTAAAPAAPEAPPAPPEATPIAQVAAATPAAAAAPPAHA